MKGWWLDREVRSIEEDCIGCRTFAFVPSGLVSSTSDPSSRREVTGKGAEDRT